MHGRLRTWNSDLAHVVAREINRDYEGEPLSEYLQAFDGTTMRQRDPVSDAIRDDRRHQFLPLEGYVDLIASLISRNLADNARLRPLNDSQV